MGIGGTLAAQRSSSHFRHLYKMRLFVYNLVTLFVTSSVDFAVATAAADSSSEECRTYTNFFNINPNARWYCYNARTHICEPVEGKSVNAGKRNCFPTVELCYWHCRAHSDCLLPRESGKSCGNKKELAYYFDSANQTCTLFLYNGCGGNFNRFASLHECHVICRGNPCVTPLEFNPEYCDEKMTFHYYSQFSGKCATNQHCNRLGTNYKTKTDCEEACILKKKP
uniref:Putative bovine pancreatic trypsin inhibitor n=1 Tax=Rhipicephalus microplus TaxID=6941 RepID=A0A6G5A8H2_RHIMP